MKTVVLGAGIIGVSTAYYLRRAGHEVTVIDRQDEPGQETSYANGGQVSASGATPWANPTAPLLLAKWLGRSDAPLVLPFRVDFALWRFLFRFLVNCRAGPSRANALKILKLALYNQTLLAALRAETGIAFDAEDRGILHIFRSERDMERAAENVDRFRALGLEAEEINAAACARLEPALAHLRGALVGGIYSPGDLSGDARAFTCALAQMAADAGVEFRLATRIARLSHSGDRVTGVMTDRGMATADRYVLALGSYSPLFLKPMGIHIPVYPTKGYSATVPVIDDARAPKVSLTDEGHKIVMSRLGNRLRIAGMAEFNGYNAELNEARARVVLRTGAALFPGALDEPAAELWSGLRPLTPDGVPIIGRSRFTNLILNTGHGTVGWTTACASGRIAADLAAGAETEIDVSDIGPDRF